jgi:hypothetical protein
MYCDGYCNDYVCFIQAFLIIREIICFSCRSLPYDYGSDVYQPSTINHDLSRFISL